MKTELTKPTIQWSTLHWDRSALLLRLWEAPNRRAASRPLSPVFFVLQRKTSPRRQARQKNDRPCSVGRPSISHTTAERLSRAWFV